MAKIHLAKWCEDSKEYKTSCGLPLADDNAVIPCLIEKVSCNNCKKTKLYKDFIAKAEKESASMEDLIQQPRYPHDVIKNHFLGAK